MEYFIFNNINSLDMGIIVNKLPSIVKPGIRTEAVVIPGRSGTIYDIDYNNVVYDSYNVQIECTAMPNANIRQLTKWLNGAGRLIISSEPNIYYEATIVNKIDFTRMFSIIYEFPLELEIQPICYDIETKEHVITKEINIIITQSTAIIKPYIVVYGTGNIYLTINNKTQILRNIDEYIELDSKFEEATKDNINKNSSINGSFLYLENGDNNINWIGNVDKIVLRYSEAYI